MPAPWLCRREVGVRSRIVTLCPKRLRGMPVRSPAREPPTCLKSEIGHLLHLSTLISYNHDVFLFHRAYFYKWGLCRVWESREDGTSFARGARFPR
jgi:hypothetical protein